MNDNLSWFDFDNGFSIGQTGVEGGEIVRDEEHADGARITLEEDCLAPFAITSGIYDWFVHTCFLETEAEAESRFENIKRDLTEMLEILPDAKIATNEETAEATVLIEDFFERYP